MEDSRSIKDFAVATRLPYCRCLWVLARIRTYLWICSLRHPSSHIDESARIAHKALALVDKPGPEEYEKGLKDIDDRGAVMELRRRYREIVLEMMLSRGVENFLTYLSEMLGAIFRARPETMRSSATIRVDEVLKHSSMDEFVSYLAEKQVNQLSYQGMRDLAAYVDQKMNFSILPRADDLDNAVRIVEYRNLIVHNRGLVNALFRDRVPGISIPIGQPLDYEFADVMDDISFLARCVFFIDAEAVQKFGLETKANPKAGLRIASRQSDASQTRG